MNEKKRTFLFWLAHEHLNFRLPECESILDLFGIQIQKNEKPTDQPYWILELTETDARKIASRSMSVKFCMELWARGQETEEFHYNLQSYLNAHPETANDRSFKINVETFCKHFTQKEKVEKIETLKYLPFEGSVNLKNPEMVYYFIEHYGLNPNSIPDEPEDLFFGKWIADGQRECIKKISLKSRKFIGNTSMDPTLSMIMANQAQVNKGDLVFDPFVGTGSLLIASSIFGGYTLGTDIDFLMLHGRTKPSRISQKVREKDENIASNMKQYDLASNFLDVVVSDFSLPLWRDDLKIDAILTDPPYGIREATEKIGTAKENPVIEEHQTATHIPSKVVYDLSHIYNDLLNFSTHHLKMGGRLVCWYPLFRENYKDDQIPTHPCLQLVANSEQILSNYTSRRLLTYVKIKEPQLGDATDATCIQNFRENYFSVREELRQVKRTREAQKRAKQKELWEKKMLSD